MAAGGIESREVLANRTGCLLRLRPVHRLVARNPLLLVHIRLDQARVDRERFAANKPCRDAHCHHALEYPTQGVALAEAFVPSPAEHRMIGDLIFDTEL